MKNQFTYLVIASLFLILSGFIARFEYQNFRFIGTVYCDGKPCPKAGVQLKSLSNPLFDTQITRTDNAGKFTVPYEGSEGDSLILKVSQTALDSMPCYDIAKIPLVAERNFILYRWLISENIIIKPIKLTCKGVSTHVNN